MDVVRLDLASGPLGLGRPALTIGNFDGLHLGHRRIVAETLSAAHERDERAIVLSFEPHPVQVLHPGSSFRSLKTLDQRLRGLAELGVDVTALVRFDLELSRTQPAVFAERILAGALGAATVLVGPSFRFGQGRGGDFAQLAELGRRHGFEAIAVEPVLDDGRPIPSTRVRQALVEGNVAAATRLLGQPYAIEGTVVRGQGRGRGLSFPTANLETANQCLPAPGVYATRAWLRGGRRRGATFIGPAATFGESRPGIETHLLEHDQSDLYGEALALEFLARVRGARRFDSPAELQAQIAADLERVRDLVLL